MQLPVMSGIPQGIASLDAVFTLRSQIPCFP
jgi:hypothetical protein